MPDALDYIGKVLIAFGIVIALLGVAVLFFRNTGIPFFGKLPGDIIIQKKNFTLYLPIVTSLLLSLIVSIILYMILKR